MSGVADAVVAAAGPLARLVADAIEGKIREPADIARALLGVAVTVAPVEDLRVYLDDAARARQDELYELARDRKFGGTDGG